MQTLKEQISRVQPTVVARQILYSAFINQSSHHFYLLVAPTLSQQRDLYNWYVMLHVCSERVDDKVCGECSGCRQVLSGNYMNDVIVTKEGDKKSIGVDVVAKLQEDFKTTATLEGRRFFCIEEADDLTIQAVNSLLKFLEEPLGEVTGFLFVTSEQKMLPTILSRAQVLRLEKVGVSDEHSAFLVKKFPITLQLKSAKYLVGNNFDFDTVVKEYPKMKEQIDSYLTKLSNGSPPIVAQTDLEEYAVKTKTGTLILNVLSFEVLEHYKNGGYFQDLPPHVAPFVKEKGREIFLSVYHAMQYENYHTSLSMIMTKMSLNYMEYQK